MLKWLNPELDEAVTRGSLGPGVAWLRQICVLLLGAVLPIAMVFSNRSSAAILVIAAGVLLMADIVQRGRLPRPSLPATWSAVLKRHKLALLMGVFLVHAAISIAFTVSPQFHAWRYVEFVVPVLSTVIFLWLMRINPLPLSPGPFAFGLAVCAGLALFELYNGSPLRAFFGLRVEDYRLNRTLVVLMILLVPYAALTYRLKRPWAGLLGVILVGWAILSSPSGAAIMGFGVSVLVFAVALRSWRIALASAFALTLLLILSAPWHGIILADILPEGLHAALRSASSEIRVDIYRAFGRAVEYAPVFGSGFNSATRLVQEPAYAMIPPKLNYLLEFGHAHNAALQIWVELGFVGAALTAAMAALALGRIHRAPEWIRPFLLACYAAAFSIALVSHGAWQAWWAAAIGIAIILFVALIARDHRNV